MRCGVGQVSTDTLNVVPHWVFAGHAYPAAEDFDFRKLYDTTNRKRALSAKGAGANASDWAGAAGAVSLPSASRVGACDPLKWLWTKALAEWA